MTIDAQGWLSWTQRMPGIRDKVYSQRNAGRGLVNHSIEGSVDGALSRFLSTAKNPDGSYTSGAAASVMFINPKVGVLIQMYPVTASTWTSGNSIANTGLWAIENEGVAGQPINANQVQNLLRLAREWEAYTGKKATRDPAGPRTLWEHNEVWNWASPNAGPTACPSGRIQPFYDALEEEDDMTEDQVREIIREELAKLNEAVVNRFRLVRLASDPEYTSETLPAVEALREKGLLA